MDPKFLFPLLTTPVIVYGTLTHNKRDTVSGPALSPLKLVKVHFFSPKPIKAQMTLVPILW